jgi:hypothetical protein
MQKANDGVPFGALSSALSHTPISQLPLPVPSHPTQKTKRTCAEPKR